MRNCTGNCMLLIVLLAACSSRNAGSSDAGAGAAEESAIEQGSASSCIVSSSEAVYMGEAPVYRDCGVDRKARLSKNVPVDFRPAITARTPTQSDMCLVAEVEFIVDPEGVPERESIGLVRATDSAFGSAVLGTVSRWRYAPAIKDGIAVRQLVRERRSMPVRAAARASSPGSRPHC